MILDSLVTGRREFAADQEFYEGEIADGPLGDIHVWDLAEAHVAAPGRFDALPGPATAINPGTGRGTTVRELADPFNRGRKPDPGTRGRAAAG